MNLAPGRLAVVDDDPLVLEAMAAAFAGRYHVRCFSEPLAARAALDELPADVALIDLQMPGLGGLELLRHLKATNPSVEVVVISGVSTVQAALEAVQHGAFDFLQKPFADLAVARRRVDAALARGRERTQRSAAESSSAIVGRSHAIATVRASIDKIAESAAPVIVLGESGTGKEVVARALHARGPRRGAAFVALNCAGMVEALLESELFGHEKGAFTGADTAHRGLFEAASGGVLFLDEIGDMPLSTQAHLLRVLQDGEIRPVGATSPRRVDVRVIAATHVDLEAATRAGRFRSDLFYRLATFRIALPPLRERGADVEILAEHLLERIARRTGAAVALRLAPATRAALARHTWPGNVRELESVLTHGAAMCPGELLEPWHLPGSIPLHETATTPASGAAASARPDGRAGSYAELRAELVELERAYFSGLLAECGGSLSEVARMAGVDRSNLRRTLRRIGLAG